MATFNVDGFARFTPGAAGSGTSTLDAVNTTSQGLTATENGGDFDFAVGGMGNGGTDQITTGGGTARDYEGTIDIDGTDYPVFSIDTGGNAGDFLVYVPTGTAVPGGDWTGITPDFETLDNTALFPICFTENTVIKTPGGDVLVRDVKIGDSILTSDGRFTSVLWVGTQTVYTKFAHNERLLPVRLMAGSLGHNVPDQDLTVSNDHAFLVDGVLAIAGSLINDTSIYRVPMSEFEDGKIAYYHIETENHELILANNTPAETFIDNVSRSTFDNFQEYVDLYGEEREMNELDYPRAMSPRQLPKSIKTRLEQRAIELGHAALSVA